MNQINEWQRRHIMYENAWKSKIKIDEDAAKYYWQQMIVCLDKIAEFISLPENILA